MDLRELKRGSQQSSCKSRIRKRKSDMTPILLLQWVIISVTVSPFKAIVFDGPCPAVGSPGPLDFENAHAHVVFFTKTESRTTHLFSSAADNLDHLSVTLTKNGQQWTIFKQYNAYSQCSSFDRLVPAAGNHSNRFKHEIWLKLQVTNLVNQTCGNLWDDYILLQRGEILIIWGCVNLAEVTKHEESVWVLLLERNVTYRQNKAQVTKDSWGMFPVGGIRIREQLDETSLKPFGREFQVQLNCKKQLCSEDPKPNDPDWDLLANIVLLCIIFLCACISVYLMWCQY